ncbi:hypothetical protein PM082_014051 [Marasmius tenuissimus]|nr:hypothetical protein PM082_014051 [Marasmius tenuissimus]
MSTSSAGPVEVSIPRGQKNVLIFITVISTLAIFSTTFRLARRIRIKRLSWDDGWAVLASLVAIGHLVMSWVIWKLVENTKPASGESLEPQLEDLFAVGLNIATIWSSRISLSLSIVRILPPSRLRTLTIVFSVACFAVGSAILTYHLVVLYFLRARTQWPTQKRWMIAGPHVIADLLASLLLVAVPLYALRKMKSLPTEERRILLILFSSTLVVLALGCATMICAIVGSEIVLLCAAHIQAIIALLACNSLVLVTVLFTLLSRRRKPSRRTSAETPGEEPDDSEYNSGEYPIGLGGRIHCTRDHHTGRTTQSESQLTEVDGMQTFSYSLGSLLDRRDSEGLDLDIENDDGASSKMERDDREKHKP